MVKHRTVSDIPRNNSRNEKEKHSKWPDVLTEDGPLLGKDVRSQNITHQMPKKVGNILMESLRETPPVTAEDFSQMLLYKLLMERDEGYERYSDVTPDLSERIKNSLNDYQGYAAFCDLLKCKNMTYTRISRSLLHILLDEVKGDVSEFLLSKNVPYARVLGFRKEATPLLTEIKKKSSIPLITKLADAKETLSPMALAFLSDELRRGSIYETVAAMKAGRRPRDERQIPIVII